MPVCRNCGVQIDEGLARCPLCQAPENGAGAPPPPAAGRVSGGRSAPLTRRRLWEIVSLFAGTGAAVVLVADFAYVLPIRVIAELLDIPAAERTRFQIGAGSPLAVLEAQRTYRSVLSDYYGALAAREQARAELEWAMGRDDP